MIPDLLLIVCGAFAAGNENRTLATGTGQPENAIFAVEKRVKSR